MARLVSQIRCRWPRTRILLRADSGFCRETLMTWSETHRVDVVFGLARNARLVDEIAVELIQAEDEAEHTGRPARRFEDVRWSTRESWSRCRRVVAEAKWTGGVANPPFVLGSSPKTTSLGRAEAGARFLSEEVYCARGDMEDRIDECQADPSPTAPRPRRSAPTSCACGSPRWPEPAPAKAGVLMCALRRIGLRHTGFAEAIPAFAGAGSG